LRGAGVSAAPDVFDDGPVKPVRIWSRIGRRPILAFGNSNGDLQMLQFAGGGDRLAMRLLLHHDDKEREFAYTSGAERVLQEASAKGWTVVSMRDDWKRCSAGRPGLSGESADRGRSAVIAGLANQKFTFFT
jgi:hypothetical protein